ncbi:hypothetical protein F5Y12DRAFT_786454 [Xylaria sp. FL1777]|nr:hypothetical protein F5Y12DRAFT_786454 [Xylaria sp. FL1777]
MPRPNSTPTPTPKNPNPIPTSSPLSSLHTTSSFASTAVASPDDVPQEAIPKARGGRGGRGDEDEEIASASASAFASDGNSDDNVYDGDDDYKIPHYHRARGLPTELKEHCRVYLEEALARQAIFLLDSLLSTRPPNPQVPAFCPPPSQISLLCSLIVHPDFTTRPKEPDWPQISLQSLAYLRDLLAVFGPINAGFKESVLFGTNATSDLDQHLRIAALESNGSYLDADKRGLVRLSPRHGGDSVWQRGRDFFGVVGWAFNCSVLYPERWQWWSRWLDFMLDLLEKDLQERYRLDTENGNVDMPLLRTSILASYVTQRSGRTTDVIMWIMKAIFADGNTSSTSVFQEVWHREHKIRSLPQQHTINKRKRGNMNIDKGEYGGYLDDESVYSSQTSEPPTPQKKKTTTTTTTSSTLEDEAVFESACGETIPLRQRLFSLVSYLCYSLHDAPLVDFSTLYNKFEQKIKELPLSVFSSFINSSTSALRVDQQIEMLQGVLFLFMPSGTPSPRRVDRVKFEQGGISPAILERCFLPYPANTIEVEDNAKMSLLLENLLMMVWRHGDTDEGFSENLTKTVLRGIEARRDKINKKKTRGRGKSFSDSELQARAALELSDARLAWLAEAIAESIGTESEEDVMDEDGGS